VCAAYCHNSIPLNEGREDFLNIDCPKI
jgi:hypothetical protein